VRKFEKEENGKGRNENLSACEAPDRLMKRRMGENEKL
jgi:hypothetical protein